MRKFKNTGRCIWCGKAEPDVTFKNKPHIVPDSVGGTELGNQSLFVGFPDYNRGFVHYLLVFPSIVVVKQAL